MAARGALLGILLKPGNTCLITTDYLYNSCINSPWPDLCISFHTERTMHVVSRTDIEGSLPIEYAKSHILEIGNVQQVKTLNLTKSVAGPLRLV